MCVCFCIFKALLCFIICVVLCCFISCIYTHLCWGVYGSFAFLVSDGGTLWNARISDEILATPLCWPCFNEILLRNIANMKRDKWFYCDKCCNNQLWKQCYRYLRCFYAYGLFTLVWSLWFCFFSHRKFKKIQKHHYKSRELNKYRRR